MAVALIVAAGSGERRGAGRPKAFVELAEVVRNLAVREQDKGLSTGEKQMYTRAKKILASEMMYALEKTEDEAEAYLDDLLQRSDKLAAAS